MEKTLDPIQLSGSDLKCPEVRVWISLTDEEWNGTVDSYRVFTGDSLAESYAIAKEFYEKSDKTVDEPVIAYEGYEYTPEAFVDEVGSLEDFS